MCKWEKMFIILTHRETSIIKSIWRYYKTYQHLSILKYSENYYNFENSV